MFLFTLLFFPLLITSYCFYYKSHKLVPVISIGLVVAILVCSFQAVFTFAHRVIPYNFAGNYLYLLFRQSLLPVGIIYAVFFLVSKDDIDFKLDSFFPLLLSFYAIYLPFVIITSSEGLYSSFSLFFKPILFGAMLVELSICLNYFYKLLNEKNIMLAVLVAVFFLIYLCLPALFETYYLIKMHTVLTLIFGILYSLLPAAVIYLKKIKVIKF